MEIKDPRDLVVVANFSNRHFGRVAQFRGTGSDKWQLVPSLFRGRPAGWTGADFDRYERSLANDFVRYAPSRRVGCPPLSDPTAWLCLMRHYGLPTRLLDWSASVFVAAFFAVWEQNGEPADIWALDTARLNECAVGRQDNLSMRSGHQLVRNLVDRPFADCPPMTETVYVIAPEVDQRLLMQQGAFTVHGSSQPLEMHPEAGKFLLRFRVGGEAKTPLRFGLEQLGFSRMTLFPDLENLALHLAARRYA